MDVKNKNIEYCREYYKINKDKHLTYLKEKIHCDICNKDINRVNFPKHCRTIKHINKSIGIVPGHEIKNELLILMERIKKLESLNNSIEV
jgi:hypothetical protein